MNIFSEAFNNNFMPHGHCYFWRPDILWTHVLSDASIALAYFCIPVILLYFLFKKKRQRIPFWWVLVLFASFIYLCGMTHVIGIITVWTPIYQIEGWLKAMTALVSVITAASLIPLIPKALTLKSAEELATVNTALNAEIHERDRIQQELKNAVRELTHTNQELEDITSITAHDLQAPLRRMISYSEALEDRMSHEGTLNEEMQKLLLSISENGRRMRERIEDVLQFSTLTADDDSFELVDCKQMVQSIAQGVIHHDDSDNISLNLDDLPTLQAPRHVLYHTLHNLMENALKYRDDTRPLEIRISAHQSMDEAGHAAWEFCVADNGIGIDNRLFDKLFKLFGRLHHTENYPGNGVGLATVKKMLGKVGGRIWVTSVPGQGSQFYFTLPVKMSV